MRRLFPSIIILCLVSLLIPSRETAAVAINVTGTEYTTFVYTENDTELTSRTTFSTTPISDYMSMPSTHYITPIIAEASANLFSVSAYSGGPQDYSTAYAKTELSFSPLMNASQSQQILFTGYDHWWWSNVYVSLFDVTSNQELWNYDVTNYATQNVDPLNPQEVIANLLTIDTDFSTAHTYELTMFTQVFPAGDPAYPMVSMRLFGLEPVPVPEPSTMLLLGSGLAGLIWYGRRGMKKQKSN